MLEHIDLVGGGQDAFSQVLLPQQRIQHRRLACRAQQGEQQAQQAQQGEQQAQQGVGAGSIRALRGEAARRPQQRHGRRLQLRSSRPPSL